MVLFFLACSPKIPAILQDNATIIHPNCNEKDYFFARGLGSTREQSIQNGRVQIAEQIRSKINSQTEMMMEYINETRSVKGVLEENSNELESFRETVKVQSSFDHAELIKTIVNPIEYNGVYRSLSCLDKSQTAQVIGDEIQPLVMQFIHLTKQAKKHHERGDTTSFSSQYNKALPLLKKISPKLYIIQSVSGTASPLEMEFRKSMDILERTADTIRNDIKIGLYFVGDVRFLELSTDKEMILSSPQLLVEAFRKGLQRNALNVRTAKICDADLTHSISLNIEANCLNYHPFGWAECSLIYNAIIQDCKTKGKFELSIADDKITGVDRNSREKSIHKAAESKHINLVMQRELRNYFPIVALDNKNEDDLFEVREVATVPPASGTQNNSSYEQSTRKLTLETVELQSTQKNKDKVVLRLDRTVLSNAIGSFEITDGIVVDIRDAALDNAFDTSGFGNENITSVEVDTIGEGENETLRIIFFLSGPRSHSLRIYEKTIVIMIENN